MANRQPAVRPRENPQMIEQVCNFLPLKVLLKARFISHNWNNSIIRHEKFPVVKVGKDWPEKQRITSFINLQHAKNIMLDNIRIQRDRPISIWELYWPLMERNLTSLTLQNITAYCTEITQLIRECTELQTLVLDDIKFEMRIAVRDGQVVKIYCDHDEIIAQHNRRHLRKVVLKNLKHGILPNCLTLLLRDIGDDTLEEFEFINNSYEVEQRPTIVPSVAQVYQNIYEILRGNLETVRKISFKNNTNGHEIFASFGDVFMLKSIHLEQQLDPVPIQNDANANPQQQQPQGQVQDTSLHFINFLRSDMIADIPVKELELKLVSTTNAALLQEVLINFVNMHRIQKLTLQVGSTDTMLNFPAGFGQQLKELIVNEEYQKTDDNQNRESISRNYLSLLNADTTRKLTMNHKMSRTFIEQFFPNILRGNLRNLTKLAIIKGEEIKNGTMQTIIGHLRNLEEVTINNSKYLTDAGITGLNSGLVNMILTKKAYHVFKNARMMLPHREGRCLAELRQLHKLNLKGCKNVSDISLHEIQSPHLVEVNLTGLINVTDNGLVWLCSKNKRLERIVTKNNRNVTHFGLNMLIKKYKRISNIHTTKECITRTLGNLAYDTDPRFNNIITVAKWNEMK